jgi:hypothetical protein
MRPTVPIALGGAGGPVMDAPEAFGIVYDPIETLAYVAAQTSRITLGTSVLDALFQSPIILARRLATLDRFSDGRLVAGVGQGWMEQEFEATGVSMKRRGAGSTDTSCLVIFDWDTIRETIETFGTAAGAAGHDADTLPIMLQVNGSVTAERLDERGPLLGSTDQVAADLDQAARLGIEHVYWNSADDPLSQLPLLEQLRRG